MSSANLSANLSHLMNLQSIHSECVDLKFNLVGRNRMRQAARVEARIKMLQIEMDYLRGIMLDNWNAKVPGLKTKLTKANADVKVAVKKIKGMVKTAKKVVEILGMVDSTLGFVAAL